MTLQNKRKIQQKIANYHDGLDQLRIIEEKLVIPDHILKVLKFDNAMRTLYEVGLNY